MVVLCEPARLEHVSTQIKLAIIFFFIMSTGERKIYEDIVVGYSKPYGQVTEVLCVSARVKCGRWCADFPSVVEQIKITHMMSKYSYFNCNVG